MDLNEIGMYRMTPGGIYLPGESVSLKIEFVEENIFRMWTTRQKEFRREETLVVERRDFDYPAVHVTEEAGFVTISTKELSARIHFHPFYVELRDAAGKMVFSTPRGETLSWTGKN